MARRESGGGEELSWPPVTHLVVHQQLAGALLLGERQTPN